MSLLYRAIWEDDRSNLVNVGAEAFRSWLAHKHLHVDSLPEEATLEGRDGPCRLEVRRATRNGLSALRASIAEDRRQVTGELWTTTLTVITPEQGPGGTLWVDVERVSDDPFSRPPFRAPVLVRRLIEDGTAGGGRPRVGHVPFEAGAKATAAIGLAGLVRNPERRITLAVFSHDEVAGAGKTVARAKAAYERLAGVAQVYLLPPDQIDEFKERVGDDLAVWGGAARLYLPNCGPAGLRPERHRYVPAFRMMRSVEAAAEEFVTLLSTMVTASPPPAGYEDVRRELDGAGSDKDSEALLDLAFGENRKLEQELAHLRAQLNAKDDQYLELLSENEILESELSRHSGMLSRLVAWNGDPNESSIEVDLPDEVVTIADAIEQAGRLAGIEVHPESPQDIDQLESAVQSSAWARAIWRGLRALDEYARQASDFDGGFWEWCHRGQARWAWPATSKKLSMTESEQVQTSERLRRCRVLPVAASVSPDEQVEMLAHLKIAEGGGPLAPRIYFYDDTKGATGKVHIGFIGPHEHMPNTRTN